LTKPYATTERTRRSPDAKGRGVLKIAQNFPTYEPNTCIISNGLASMGIALPGAVAADFAVEHNVVAAMGDGGFPMNGT